MEKSNSEASEDDKTQGMVVYNDLDVVFEQGPNPIYFSKDSPQSQDLANSFSVKELLAAYKKTGEIPDQWEFTGPKTAKYELGELEWFIGTYSISNFKVDKKRHIISFTACNKSNWHSGTRLPKTWQDYIQEKTGYEIEDLVSSEPRGKVLQNKIHKLILNSDLKNPISKGIINLVEKLPSFGGGWEQYYEVEVPFE